MALGGEIYHHMGLFFLKKLVNTVPVADIQLHEAEIGVCHRGIQSGQIAGIGQLVHADDAIVRVLILQIKDEIRADKTGAAGDDDGHSPSPFGVDGAIQPFADAIFSRSATAWHCRVCRNSTSKAAWARLS